MRYFSHREGNVISCSADALVNATPRDIIEAHTLEKNAAKFRDVKKYSKFEVGSDGVINMEFPAKIAFFSFTQKFCKRASFESIRFWTPDDSLSQIRGSWTLKRFHGKTLVKFEQVVKVPGWATMFPLESYIRSRVMRMMEDTAALPVVHDSRALLFPQLSSRSNI